MSCASTYGRLLDDVVEGRLTGKRWERLRGHLALCEPCRKKYDRAVYVERLLSGGPKALRTPAPSELVRVGQAALAGIPGVETPSPWAWMRWLLLPAALATASAFFLIPRLGQHETTLAVAPVAPAREGTAEAVLDRAGGASSLPASVSAYCAGAGGAANAVQDSVPQGQPHALGPEEECPREGELRFAYSNRAPSYKYVFVFGIDGQLGIKWYQPASAQASSVAIKSSVQDEPIDGAVALKAEHKAGPLRIVALFSQRALGAAQVQSAIDRARRERRGVATLDRLDGLPAGVYQSSVLVGIR